MVIDDLADNFGCSFLRVCVFALAGDLLEPRVTDGDVGCWSGGGAGE